MDFKSDPTFEKSALEPIPGFGRIIGLSTSEDQESGLEYRASVYQICATQVIPELEAALEGRRS